MKPAEPAAEAGGDSASGPRDGLFGRLIGFFLHNPAVGLVLLGLACLGGAVVSPFETGIDALPRAPVSVDAIPDTGENQQIVFTEWPGHSPQDVEDQLTYPLSTALLGVPGVTGIRASSMFGFSSIAVVFDERVEFYWSRSRLLEKLASLPAGTLPAGAQPALGPDATGLGQVFWYTLEGLDGEGRARGGFGLEELRRLQDFEVGPALASVEGVAEVGSIGGHTAEFQVDVDPDAMLAAGVTLDEVYRAVASANADVGARTIELNRVEYVVRGLGLVRELSDLERAVVRSHSTPAGPVAVTVADVAAVALGPGPRRGVLDRAGREVVGGVVTVRYGANPLEVIERVRARIAELAPTLPQRALSDGSLSQVTLRPFYDRAELIAETLGTLRHALALQLLATVLVVVVMVGHLRAAGLIAGLLPVTVLVTFLAMKGFGVDANVVALAGIAIAIGTLVDMGIVLVEGVLAELRPGQTREQRLGAIQRGASEVGGAVATAVATTVVGFLPVFAMTGPEGKLFTPLAATKTFALVAAVVLCLTVLPALMGLLLRPRALLDPEPGSALAKGWRLPRIVVAVLVFAGLTAVWMPLGPAAGFRNTGLVGLLVAVVLLVFIGLLHIYEPVLRWCLRYPLAFLSLPAAAVVAGLAVWLGVARIAQPLVGWAGIDVEQSALGRAFPGLGVEFMPRLDEGSFLLMPVTLPTASIAEALELLQLQDRRIAAIPEVRDVVGKIGRVDSALDPAPVSMVETLITYLPEYRSGADGRPLNFAFERAAGEFRRDAEGELVPDANGRPFRQWRDEIEDPQDLWDAIAAAADVPGMTTASRLQPIETRQIMLQTGLRSTFGVKVAGPDLATIEAGALAIEAALKDVPGVRPETVFADRVSGKPYLELELDRDALVRHGLSVRAVQDAIEIGLGGRAAGTVLRGRERYTMRVRLPRELRGEPALIEQLRVGTPAGAQVPLGDLVRLRQVAGPQSIRSEDTFPVAYVLFDGEPDVAELDLVARAREHLEALVERGELELPAGVRYRFAGGFENQVRAAERLRLVLPIALALIFLILLLQLRSSTGALIVFSGVFVAWGGGFLGLWLYAQPWFLDLELFGADLRELFQIGPVNLSVAVWVGFLALFGIATDDGVVMTTYLNQGLRRTRPATRTELAESIVAAGLRRIRPCMLTTATTVLALLPVLASTGKGASVLVPMALPSVGGMLVVSLTVFTVPTLFWLVERRRLPS